MESHEAIIPQSLRRENINIVHKGHQGIEATKRSARGVIFWSTMSKNITEELLSCAVCNQRKEPLKVNPVPDLPWSTVAADILDWHGKQYQVLVDSYSGWFEVDLLRDLTLISRHIQIEKTLFGTWYTSRPHHGQ